MDLLLVSVLFASRDGSSSTSEMTPEERREQQKIEEALHASSLRVPRRFVFFSLPNYASFCIQVLVGQQVNLFLVLGPHGMLGCLRRSSTIMNDNRS